MVGIYKIGGQCQSRRAGWWAALIVALDGLLVAFGRIVQYQSLVIMFGVLGLLCALRYDEAEDRRYLWVSAFLLAMGLLAHSDGVFAVAPTGLIVIGGMWRRGARADKVARALLGPAGLAAGILASFYVPYALHPQASGTASYWASRIGSPPYNHLGDHLTLLTAYNAVYYVILIALGLSAFALDELSWVRRRRWLLVLAGGCLLVSPVLLGRLWGFDLDLSVVLFTLLLGALLFLGRRSQCRAAILLWFGLPFLLYTFLSLDPRSHIYTAVPGAALLVGIELDRLGALGKPWRGITSGLAIALLGLSAFYSWVAFVRPDPEYQRSYPEHRIGLFWTPFGEAFPRDAVFGFPHRSAWKAIGMMFATGQLEGSYASNEETHITQWYTRNEPNCARLPHYYILADNVQDPLWVDAEAIQERYDLVGRVWVQGRPAIEIHQLEPVDQAYQDYALAGVGRVFDAYLSDPDWSRRPTYYDPLQRVQVPAQLSLGESIEFLGHRLVPQQVRAGDAVRLTLYWSAIEPVLLPYTVFAHIESDDRVWGQKDNAPGCGQRPTTEWRPGQVVVDPYTIEVSRQTPAGEYRLLVGLYLPATGERLPVADVSGAPLGDAVDLGVIHVTER